MFEKLKEFYLFYMLPSIIYPNNHFSLTERRWTTVKEIQLLQNGLINDVNYYKSLPNGRGYVVSIMDNLDFSVNEIFIQDYLTLSSGEQLCDFIIDHAFHIFNNNNDFQIVSVAKSSIIFGKDDMTCEFVKSITLKNDKLAMPVNTGNHYVLVVAYLKEHKMTILDPLGNEDFYSPHFQNRWHRFIMMKDGYEASVQIKKISHAKQTDNINCGVYIIHFFSCIIRQKDLTGAVDTDQLRALLKELLIYNCSDMAKRCLFCTRMVKTEESSIFRCKTCLRYIHHKCLLSFTEMQSGTCREEKTANGICDLCRVN